MRSCSEPIQDIVDCDNWCNWWFEYHVWNVPNAFICPKVTRSATNAPKTVRYPLSPGRSSVASFCVQRPVSSCVSTTVLGSVFIVVVVERELIELGAQSHFSWSCMGATRAPQTTGEASVGGGGG